jgi:hypothetical protein
LAKRNTAIIKPDLDPASSLQCVGQVADEGLVLARMGEKDSDHDPETIREMDSATATKFEASMVSG